MPVKKTKPAKNIIFWVAAGAIIILLWSLLQTPSLASKEINFSQFMNDVENKKVEEVTITGIEARGTYLDGSSFKTDPSDRNTTTWSRSSANNKVDIVVKDTNRSPWFSVPLHLVPHPPPDPLLGLLHAPDAVRREQGHVLRQEPGQALLRTARKKPPSRTSPASRKPRRSSRRSSAS